MIHICKYAYFTWALHRDLNKKYMIKKTHAMLDRKPIKHAYIVVMQEHLITSFM